MRIARTRPELLDFTSRGSGPVFLVPTMGALHEGHLSLIKLAREKNKRAAVVMSLFVNPTQFNDPADLEKYPRDEENDFRLAKKAGCDAVFAPSSEVMYPDGIGGTQIHVPVISEKWEGAHRPGHFDGVATVVAKLFNVVMPDVAFFGEKDWQQCRVIEAMVRDLDFPLELAFGPTIRENDGLAMSSRNKLLNAVARAKAPLLYDVLCKAAREFARGGEPRALEKGCAERLLSEGFQSVDYIALVDSMSLERVKVFAGDVRVLGAATIGGVRLIDNVPVLR